MTAIENIKDFKEGGYYRSDYHTPMGSTFDGYPFFIVKISKRGVTTIKYSNGTGEKIKLTELKSRLAAENYRFFHTDKQTFIKGLLRYISEKKNELKRLSKEIGSLEKLITGLP